MYNYTAFSLRIQSDIFFPELLISTGQLHDVYIRLGQVPRAGLSDPQSGGLYYQIKPNVFWLHVPSIGRFLVTDGRHITIEPEKGVSADSLRVFILAPCFSALLMQRAFFVLQGAVLQSGDHAIAILGGSGAGKSTVSAALLKKKYTLLSDEVCVLNNHLDVMPGYPQISLWLRKIGAIWFKKIREGVEKYMIPISKKFNATPLPIKKIIILNPSKKNQHIQARPLSGGDKINYLQKYIYNKTYISGLGMDALYFNYTAKLANKVDVILIDWPIAGGKVKKLVNCIDQIILGVEHVI